MDSKAAAQVLINPLNEPEPSAQDGPGTHFVRPVESSASSTVSTNPYRRSSPKQPSVTTSPHIRQTSRGSNSASGSPKADKFPRYRAEELGVLNDGPSPRRSHDYPPSYHHVKGTGEGPSRRRGSSLKERFPGDDSNKPLDIIRRDSKKAHRSPHLNKRHLPGADMIDRLDPTINKVPYHHEGPYDAASLARNTDVKSSPVAALSETNKEALRATAQENIQDSLSKHKPLDGVAFVPPGVADRFGRTLDYQEGDNQLIDNNPGGGPYKRFPGVEYAHDDVHGQGEPSYSLDRALQNHTIHERDFDGKPGIELSDRPTKGGKRRSLDTRDPIHIAGDDGKYADLQHAADTDAHTKPMRKGSIKEGLKRRIGSIKRKGLDEYLP